MKAEQGAATSIAKRIAEAVEAKLRQGTSREEIIQAIGYRHIAVLGGIESGHVRLPLDKVPQVARALGLDIPDLFRLAVQQFWPDDQPGLDEVFARVVSPPEFEIIKIARRVTANEIPAITPAMEVKLVAVFDGEK